MTVSVLKHLDSDTIRIPEAAALVGQDVRITVEGNDAGGMGPLNWAGQPYDAQALVDAMDTARGTIEFDDAAMADLDRRSTL